MTKKVREIHPAPWAWEGLERDPDYWLRVGAGVVLQGDQLSIQGVDLPPLWSWFDQTRPVPADKVARLFCHCGTGPLGLVWRVWQPGRETVAKVTYLQRRTSGRGDQMVELSAVLHLEAEDCRHGPLLLHRTGRLRVHCRSHDLTLTGGQIVGAVGSNGGWTDATPDVPPSPRRLVLYS